MREFNLKEKLKDDLIHLHLKNRKGYPERRETKEQQSKLSRNLHQFTSYIR
jgi:hypothetical protein